MAIAFVAQRGILQPGAASAGHIITLTSPTAIAVGDHLTLRITTAGASTGVPSSITDARNTWADTGAVADNGSNLSVRVWSCRVAVAYQTGDTITVNLGASRFAAAVVEEWSGLAATGWVNVVKGAADTTGTDTAFDTGLTAATAVADSLLLGVNGVTTINTWTPEVLSPVWNKLAAAASTSTVRKNLGAYRIVAATGTYQYKGTYGTAGVDSEVIVVFKGAAAAQGVTPALLSQTAAPTAPAVTATASIAPALLNRTATTSSPVVVLVTQFVAPALLDRTAVPTSPAVTATATVAPSLLDRTATTTAPVVTVGPVTVAPALLNRTAVPTAPAVTATATVSPSLLDRTATATAPAITATATVAPALLSRVATPTAPAITATATVAPALVDRTATPTAPTVAAGAVAVGPALLNRTATPTAPSVAPGPATVAPSLLDRTAVPTAPAVTTATAIAAPSIDRTAVAIAPSLGGVAPAQDLTPGLLDRTAVPTAPSVSAAAAAFPAVIDNLAAAFAPAVTAAAAIAPAVIDRTATAAAPEVSSIRILPELVDALASTFEPTVAVAGVDLAPLRIDQPALAFAPALSYAQDIALELVDQGAVLFAPSVFLGQYFSALLPADVTVGGGSTSVSLDGAATVGSISAPASSAAFGSQDTEGSIS
jgi:hypothetical protein